MSGGIGEAVPFTLLELVALVIFQLLGLGADVLIAAETSPTAALTSSDEIDSMEYRHAAVSNVGGTVRVG